MVNMRNYRIINNKKQNLRNLRSSTKQQNVDIFNVQIVKPSKIQHVKNKLEDCT